MANASAKKAAAAKASIENFYKPFLFGINVFYLLLHSYIKPFWDIKNHNNNNTLLSLIGTICILGILFSLQYYSYCGIIDHTIQSSSKRKSNDPSFMGGPYLDLLATIMIIQFGGLLLSYKFYYLLFIVAPIWFINHLRKVLSLFKS